MSGSMAVPVSCSPYGSAIADRDDPDAPMTQCQQVFRGQPGALMVIDIHRGDPRDGFLIHQNQRQTAFTQPLHRRRVEPPG